MRLRRVELPRAYKAHKALNLVERAPLEPSRPRGWANRQLRARVFATFGRRCRECGRSDVRLEAHHVNGDPTDNRILNLIPLCRDCHYEATFPDSVSRKPGSHRAFPSET